MIPAIYDLYENIVLNALKSAKLKINKCRKNFMLEIFMLYLSIPGRINFLQLGRYSRHGEQRFRRQFEEKFDFFSFNSALCEPFHGNRTALAIDASFIHKSGKQTPCIGYFLSGCAGKSLRGLEVLSLSLVDAGSRMSFHLSATQTPPVPCLHDNNLTLPDWYAAVVKHHIKQIRPLTNYLVADAFFSKKGFVNEILSCGLHLVSKLRDDADLLYLNKQEKNGKRGRPAKYKGKIDPTNIDTEYFLKVENDKGINAKSAVVYSKSLQREILVVVEEFVIHGKTKCRLLFSTDVDQSTIDVIDIYHTRFQMEFGFRDAKQATGLEQSQARSINKLDFHFNTALTAVNVAKIMQLNDKDTKEQPFSIKNCKALFANAMMLSLFFDKFGILPNTKKKQAYVEELLYFGIRAA